MAQDGGEVMPNFMFRRIVNGKLEARTIEADTLEEAQRKLDLGDAEDEIDALDDGEQDIVEPNEIPFAHRSPIEPPFAKPKIIGNPSYLKLAMAELEEELRGNRDILSELDKEFPGIRR
jgi:hypothetical protein